MVPTSSYYSSLQQKEQLKKPRILSSPWGKIWGVFLYRSRSMQASWPVSFFLLFFGGGVRGGQTGGQLAHLLWFSTFGAFSLPLSLLPTTNVSLDSRYTLIWAHSSR